MAAWPLPWLKQRTRGLREAFLVSADDCETNKVAFLTAPTTIADSGIREKCPKDSRLQQTLDSVCILDCSNGYNALMIIS